MNKNQLPLISLLEPAKDTDTIIACEQIGSISSRIEKNKFILPLFYDPARIVYKSYDSSTKKMIIMVTNKKVSDFKAITQRLINLLKDGYRKGFVNELQYYNMIAGYLILNHINKPADKEILKTFTKFGKIPFDKQGYFKCLIVDDIWKHGVIHIDIAGTFYWYDIIKDQYYCDKCGGLVEYPPLTIPIVELSNDYMDIVKMKKPVNCIDDKYLATLFLNYAKSICAVENNNYEGGIIL